MKKTLPVVIVIAALIIIGAIASSVKRTKTVDWKESFNEQSVKPYGLKILYNELSSLFPDHKIRTVYHQPSSYLKENSKSGYGDHEAAGNYIIIGNSNYLTTYSVDALLKFVEEGNTLFISSYYYTQALHDTLNIDIDFDFNPKKDSISKLSFKNKDFAPVDIDKNAGDYYFSNLNQTGYEVLGYAETDEKRPNFIRVPFGDGRILLHTEPKIFSNYNILKDDRYTYVEHVLSYIPDGESIYFDSFLKYQTPYNTNVEEESNLSWFLEQLAFRWAWYTALVFLILFMIFNAKRRQRIIKIITPLRNTSLAFVKTISNLYIEAKDYRNLTDKKITYFLEKIRTDYNLDTSTLDEEFIKKLAAKAGKKTDDVTKLVACINRMRAKDEFFEDNLVELNRYIEAFYSK